MRLGSRGENPGRACGQGNPPPWHTAATHTLQPLEEATVTFNNTKREKGPLPVLGGTGLAPSCVTSAPNEAGQDPPTQARPPFPDPRCLSPPPCPPSPRTAEAWGRCNGWQDPFHSLYLERWHASMEHGSSAPAVLGPQTKAREDARLLTPAEKRLLC